MLEIKDNGIGFDSGDKKAGIGLVNIQNRAQIYNGNVQITTSPGNGCILKIKFINTQSIVHINVCYI